MYIFSVYIRQETLMLHVKVNMCRKNTLWIFNRLFTFLVWFLVLMFVLLVVKLCFLFSGHMLAYASLFPLSLSLCLYLFCSLLHRITSQWPKAMNYFLIRAPCTLNACYDNQSSDLKMILSACNYIYNIIVFKMNGIGLKMGTNAFQSLDLKITECQFDFYESIYRTLNWSHHIVVAVAFLVCLWCAFGVLCMCLTKTVETKKKKRNQWLVDEKRVNKYEILKGI